MGYTQGSFTFADSGGVFTTAMTKSHQCYVSGPSGPSSGIPNLNTESTRTLTFQCSSKNLLSNFQL